MDFVDLERIEGDLYEAKGHLPEYRIRRTGSMESGRKVPKGLPSAVYDHGWVNSLDERRKPHIYQPSVEEFTWMLLKRR